MYCLSDHFVLNMLKPPLGSQSVGIRCVVEQKEIFFSGESNQRFIGKFTPRIKKGKKVVLDEARPCEKKVITVLKARRKSALLMYERPF